MAQTNGLSEGVNGMHITDYDVIVIGAGFSGIRIIPELRRLGLSYKVLEAGTGVGGTWVSLSSKDICENNMLMDAVLEPLSWSTNRY